ncbi:uncharacterized protein CDV56_102808 [Aspergillus thermomutatus]|uniref:Uncharacterized protein n=1 Tax=Aspergillus thermomutatus TaxID=41047 RepID=A0A397HVQ0_ASPTH|nr:uncharacterized protein CDV56_102808 [Aspergillus thermomutatus]RHZ64690.1 hypothetical protein CDV56_102808 [Aspergillus thermomutatus]
MQGLWSRVAPTQSACRCVSCLSTSATGITSRTATAASKRRLRIGNSVTALYTSIFAAAALADAQAKDKRRHEWAEKIAAVKEEVNELVDEEHRLLEALQARRLRTLSHAALQKRSFTTLRSIPTARSGQSLQRNPPSRWVHAAQDLDHEVHNEFIHNPDPEEPSVFLQKDEFEQTSRDLRGMIEDDGDFDDDTSPIENAFFLEDVEIPKWLSDDSVRQKAIRKLALKQLAIRLLLRESVAHNYAGIPMKYSADFEVPQLNFAELLTELNNIRRRIRLLKTNQGAFFDDLAKELRVRSVKELQIERDRLDDEASRDVSLFLRDKMSLQELLLRLANNLLQSSDPDRPYCMKLMILTFTKSMQNDLTELVLRTLLPHRFPLNSSLIISILTYFKKAKNLQGFDAFLRMLRGEGYPVDMGRLGYYKRMVVNGVEITVPPVASANPVIYTTLITAALRFNQPDRADAWLQAGRQHGVTDDFSTLYAYLKYYARRSDWRNGLYTLRRSLAFLTCSTLHSLRHVERLIAHMVQLCDWCGKWELSDAMIKAAIDSGFDWSTAIKNQQDINLAQDPRIDVWQKKVDEKTIEKRSKPVWEKTFAFADLFVEQLDDLIISEEKDPATRWQSMVALHSREVLSAMLAGPLHKYKDAKPTDPAPQRILSPDDANFVEHVDSGRLEEYAISTTNAQKMQQEEINNLRSEVQQLKNIVSQLHRTVIQKPSSTPFRDGRRAGRQDFSTVASISDAMDPPEGKRFNLRFISDPQNSRKVVERESDAPAE